MDDETSYTVAEIKAAFAKFLEEAGEIYYNGVGGIDPWWEEFANCLPRSEPPVSVAPGG